MKFLAARYLAAILALAGLAALAAARAQRPSDAPPPMPSSEAPASAAASSPPAQPPSAPQPAAQAPAATPGAKDAAVPNLGDVPTTAPIPPAHQVSGEAQVEQVRNGTKHVQEVIVTPAGTNIHYTLVNREGQRPLSPLGITPGGLSTQRFLHLDF